MKDRIKKDVILRLLRVNLPSFLTGVICLIIVIGILLFPIHRQESKVNNLNEYSSISAICELATLRSFYHNVAVYEREPSGSESFFNDILLWPFGGFVRTGYKQFWMEYSGIVETGIDVSQVQINSPDANGIVDVYLPDAKILSVYADEDTLSEPISEKGLFTSITGEEQAEAFAMAQSAMRQEAENDQALLRRAKNNAKLLLEQYIVNTGKELNIDYSVNWISNPL